MISDFKNDMLDLFEHKQGGHVQKWLYSDLRRPKTPSGHKLWHNFLASNENYYPIQAEISLIPEVIRMLRKTPAVLSDNLVDFGVGDEQATTYKGLRFARKLPLLSRYTGVDLIRDQLFNTGKIINRHRPDLVYTPIVADFFKDNVSLSGRNKLGMLVGLTISNQPMMENEPFPRHRIVAQMRQLHTILKDGGNNYLLISYDANSDLDAAWQAYNHETWRQMMRGLMMDLKIRLQPGGNFNPGVWRYSHSTDTQKHVVSHVLYPTADQEFTIDGQTFNIKKGERFVVKNNFKYPTSVFQDLCQEAGFKIKTKPVGARDHTVKFQLLTVD